MDSTHCVSERLTCKNENCRQVGIIYFYMQGVFAQKTLKKFQYRTIYHI
jgi:hypothetical protein